MARAGPAKRAWMTLMICGMVAAAPAPWAKRAMMSTVMPGAKPQTAELSVNSAMPARNIRRRPARSPSRAPVIRSIA